MWTRWIPAVAIVGAAACGSSSPASTPALKDGGVGLPEAGRDGGDAGADVAALEAAAPIDSGVGADTMLPADVGAPDDGAPLPDTSGPPHAGVFVAVGYGGRRIRSLDDGATWVDDQELEASGGDDMENLRVVVWGDSQFVGLGWRVMTSPDGQTWNDRGTSPLDNWIGGATYAENKFVGVGGYGLRDISTDAITWTTESIDTAATHAYDGVAWGAVGNGIFVSANDSGARSYSADGTHWMYSSSLTSTASTHLAFGGGVFVGIGGTQVVTSSDGVTWTAAATLGASPGSVLFAAGQFTAVADGHVYTSSNGVAWTDHVSSSANAGQVAYGDGSYVWVNGVSPRRSPDGINWTVVTLTGTNSLNSVTFGSL